MRGVHRSITTTFLVVIILGAAIVVTAVYFNFFLSKQNRTGSVAAEIGDFPIYPNAKFIEKADLGPCPSGRPQSIICEAFGYKWQTTEDYFQVSEWYKEDRSHSGWKCSGGAGSVEGS